MPTAKDRFTNLMKKYWSKKISQETLAVKYLGQFSTHDLIEALEKTHSEKDAQSVKAIFHIGFTFNLFDAQTVPILCTYLNVCWHNRHEDIAIILKELKAESSIKPIITAIHRKCDYWYDDGDAFIRKCIYVLSAMNTQESLAQLKILSLDANEIIKKYAEKELGKIR